MKLAFFTLLAVLILVKNAFAGHQIDYYEEEYSEELLCSSNEECLEMNSNKPICRQNNCQPECTPMEPCRRGQYCIDGRCNNASDVQDQPTIINKVVQVNPVDLPIVKKISAEKDTPQGSKRKADRNFKIGTTTEAGDYFHTDHPNYDGYFNDRNFEEETTSEALSNDSEYFEEEKDMEELLCSSNEECLEISPNKPICRKNNCQPECTPVAPCLIGQSCIDGRCNIEKDVEEQHTIINKVIQVNPGHRTIIKKIPAEKDTPQGSKHRADRNFKEETTTEAGDYYHTDYPNYDDYFGEGTDYYNDEETSKGSDGTNSYNFYQLSTTDNLIISDQNIA